MTKENHNLYKQKIKTLERLSLAIILSSKRFSLIYNAKSKSFKGNYLILNQAVPQ